MNDLGDGKKQFFNIAAPRFENIPIQMNVLGKTCKVYSYDCNNFLELSNHVLMILEDGCRYWVPVEHLLNIRG